VAASRRHPLLRRRDACADSRRDAGGPLCFPLVSTPALLLVANVVPNLKMNGSDTLPAVGMNIIKNRVNDVTVLDIQGVIKLGESAREFSSYLEKVLNDETGPVMINFEAINYMDSTGLGELIGYLQKFEDRQRKMALVKPSHRILALLKITKLDTVFKIFDSRDTAMSYLTESVA
jgi:anti-anti-sigma factor